MPILVLIYKSQKGLLLETKNTQNHENLRLGLIESIRIQHCRLRGCIACDTSNSPDICLHQISNYFTQYGSYGLHKISSLGKIST